MCHELRRLLHWWKQIEPKPYSSLNVGKQCKHVAWHKSWWCAKYSRRKYKSIETNFLLVEARYRSLNRLNFFLKVWFIKHKSSQRCKFLNLIIKHSFIHIYQYICYINRFDLQLTYLKLQDLFKFVTI